MAGLAAALMTLGGCQPPEPSGQEPTTHPTEVKVFPTELSLEAGAGAQLSAQVNDAGGHPIGRAPIEFHTADARLVSVSSHGFVSATGPAGRATIRVTSGSREAIVPVLISAAQPSQLEKLRGEGQRGVVGSTLPEPLVVRVMDAYGNPSQGCHVRFSEISAGTTIAEAACDAEGRAEARLSLPPLAGAVTVAAISSQNEQARTLFTFEALPDAPVHVEAIEPRESSTVAGGASIRAALRVADEHGNGVADVEVDWSVIAGDGTVEAPSSLTDKAGIASTRWTSGPLVGRNVLRASVPRIASGDVEISVTTVAGPVEKITLVRGADQTARPRSAVRRPPAFRITDAHGNPVSGAAVAFATDTNGGSVSPEHTVSDATGMAAVSQWILGDAGTHQLSARVVDTEVLASVTARAAAKRK